MTVLVIFFVFPQLHSRLFSDDYDRDMPLRSFNDMKGMVEFALDSINHGWNGKDFKKRLINYGCHCFQTDSRMLLGQGRPLDKLDRACMELKRCRRCITMEFSESENFEVHTLGYRFDMTETDGIQCETDRNTGVFLKSVFQVSNQTYISSNQTIFFSNQLRPYLLETALFASSTKRLSSLLAAS